MVLTLHVIALVSGGKDSLFSLLHCQANGHQVVALANLHPPSGTTGDHDMDSYMYQTVGHSVIPLYEQALGIPLYRQPITGRAVNSTRDYATPSRKQEQDETEDLIPLLARVLEAHPEANAVSTGAILSTYQRTRVESVARRLGLTPLSYLWQYPRLPPYTQSSLLHDMASVGQKAVVVKTASGGLDEAFLGLDVAAHTTIASLGHAMGRYGAADHGAILGEGGEFETLALDGPSPLWKKRIRLQVGPPLVLDGGQTVHNIRMGTLEEKREDAAEMPVPLRIPELMDDEFHALLVETTDRRTNPRSLVSEAAVVVMEESTPTSHRFPTNAANDSPTVFTYANLTSDPLPNSFSSSSPSRQMTKIFLRLDHALKQWQLSPSAINHCTLLLRDMRDFAVINSVYGQYFHHVNPPARVTMALGNTMPENIDVMLSVIVDKEEKDCTSRMARRVERQGLHVQSRSYWAPANIGPYSQAISAQLPWHDANEAGEGPMNGGGEVVYVAGQIPLVPASMEVYHEHGFRGQAVLSLQHLWRIGRAKGVKWWTTGLALIPPSEHAEEQVRIAQETWTALHTRPTPSADEEDASPAEIDPWDRLNRHHASTVNHRTYRAPLPDRTALGRLLPGDGRTPLVPPCFVAQVSALPRAVDVEWTAMGLTASSIAFTPPPTDPPLTLSSPSGSRARFFALAIRSAEDLQGLRTWREASRVACSHATLYAGPGLDVAAGADMDWRGMQWVPCRRVWGEGGREVRGVLMGRVE